VKRLEIIKTSWKQALLVLIAFLIMTVASYVYVSTVMKRQSDLHGRSEIKRYQTSLRALIQANDDALLHVSSMMALNLDRKATADEQLNVLRTMTNVFSNQKNIQNVFQSVYGFLDGNFIDGSGLISGAFFNPKTASWLRGAVLTTGIYHSEPFIDNRTGNPVASLSMVVFDKSGESRGVLAIDYLLAPVVEEVSDFKVGGVGFGILIDSKKNILSHPEKEMVGRRLDDIPWFSGISKNLPKDYADVMVEWFNINGRQHIGFFSRLENNWYLGIMAPKNAYYAEVVAMFPAILAISLFLTALLSVVLIRLNMARQRSDEENRLKSSFLARMSHEIRTPMNAIIGLSELAQRDFGKPASLGYIKNIRKAGGNLLSIINDILDFSKIESGKYQVNIQPYQTGRLLAEVMVMMNVRLGEKPLLFLTDIDENIPRGLLGDDRSIRQVLVNLLSNAIKYTEKGFIKLTVRSEPVDEGQIRLVFAIEDSGLGIKKEDMANLFGDFVRLKDSTGNRYVEGSGLGLAIAKNLCQMMGGDLTVESKYGEGSIFTATFCQAVSDHGLIEHLPDLAFETEPDELSHKTVYTAPDYSIMIIDDVSTNLMVVQGLIEPYGMQVTCCLSGAEAVSKAKNEYFDMYFIDQMMPGMDGLETLKKLKEIWPASQKVTTVAFTANAVSGAKEMLMDSGFDDFISKPVLAADLAALFDKWVPKDVWVKSRERNLNEDSQNEAALRPVSIKTGIDALIKEGDDDFLKSISGHPGFYPLESLKKLPKADLKLYRKILTLFLQDAENLTKMMGIPFLGDFKPPNQGPGNHEEGVFDLQAVTVNVHALKSATYNIGAIGLSQRAAALEAEARSGNLAVFTDGTFGAFLADLDLLRSFLKEALVGDHSQATPQLETATLVDLKSLKELKEALQAKNVTEADRLIDELIETANETDKELLSEISNQILISEFAMALVFVERLENRGGAC
jgi:signal transduction histidine kinase/DNA-binding NarL/FixJ family response regulator/HPt (histidine-containing phosphotransfer) domain-containing protein